MTARQNYFAEQRTRSTTTSTTYGDFLQLTFTPDANSDYFIIWGCVVDSTSNGNVPKVRLRDVAGSADLAEVLARLSSANEDKWPCGGLARLSFGASPGAQDLRIQFAASAGSPTIGCDEGFILAIKADAADAYAENNSATAANDSYVTAATLSFTPASSGDYLLIFSGEFGATDNTGVGYQFKLDKSGELAKIMMGNISLAASGWAAGISMVKLTGLSGAQSILAQIRNESGFGVETQVRKARVLALRLDVFEASGYAESRVRATYNTDTTEQTKVTLTMTPANVEHLVLHAMALDSTVGPGLVQSVGRAKEGSTTKSEMQISTGDTNDRKSFLNICRATLAAASTDFKVGYLTENTSNTVGISEAAVAVLQTGAAGGGGSPEPLTRVPRGVSEGVARGVSF